jgi:hypothetical protein
LAAAGFALLFGALLLDAVFDAVLFEALLLGAAFDPAFAVVLAAISLSPVRPGA